MNASTNNDTLDLLIQNELGICSLYKACASRFPDLAEFWQKIALEEKAHAEVIRELAKKKKNQKVFLNRGKFNISGLKTVIDYVNRQREKVESGSVTLPQILALARDLEQSIVEKDFFEIFESDMPAIKHEFTALRQHTVEHTARIAALLNKLKDQQAPGDKP